MTLTMGKTTLQSIDKRLKSIEKILKKEYEEEKKIEAEQILEEKELEKIEKLEQELEKEIHTSPLKNITYRGFTKSAVGAFFGILGHFSFFYGIKISEHISMTRASVLYVIAFIIGAMFLYFTGFRKVTPKTVFHLVPLRLLVIYVTSIATILLVLYLYDYVSFGQSFAEVYKTVATISILAVMGAATADLIGREQNE
jgi:uncharacterized membrane protein